MTAYIGTIQKMLLVCVTICSNFGMINALKLQENILLALKYVLTAINQLLILPVVNK